MTREELEARIDENLASFKNATTYALSVLDRNWKERVQTLAQKDLDLLEDTRAAMSYLVSRVYRRPRLLLTSNMAEYTQNLENLNAHHRATTRMVQGSEKLPMVAIVDMEDLFDRTENLLHFSIAVFKDGDYAPKEKGKGFFSSILGG